MAILDRLDERLKKKRDDELYRRVCTKRDRVMELETLIEAEASNLDFTRSLARQIGELLALKPGHWMERYLAMCPGELKPGAIETLDLGGGAAIPFAWVPPGTFFMGGGGGKPGAKLVEISAGFGIGIYPVTQQQWQAVMGSNPSHFCRAGGGKDAVKSVSDADLRQFPVESVSWEDAQQFIEKLNSRGGEWLYRLPTEAEWEYSCRGGATSQSDCSFHFYLDRQTNDLSSGQANFDGNHPEGNAKKGPYLQRPTKVGSYKPNRLGLYDMHGNVWEWCEDWYEEGVARPLRGGGWYEFGRYCQAAYRFRYAPSDRLNHGGLRLARVPVR